MERLCAERGGSERALQHVILRSGELWQWKRVLPVCRRNVQLDVVVSELRKLLRGHLLISRSLSMFELCCGDVCIADGELKLHGLRRRNILKPGGGLMHQLWGREVLGSDGGEHLRKLHILNDHWVKELYTTADCTAEQRTKR